jgi:hypothetical protein
MRRDRSSVRRRRTTVFYGPLPRLVLAIVLAVMWLARGLIRLVRATATALADLRGSAQPISVVALLANRKRAAAIEGALRGAARRHLCAFNLDLDAPLLVVVRETAGPLGDEHSTVEREALADGTSRWLITLAAWPRGAALPLGPDGLIAELSRILVQVQRSSDGASVVSLTAQAEPWTVGHRVRQRDPRFHIVASAGARDGHGAGPFDEPPASA